MVWKAYYYCFCGGWCSISNRERNKRARCPICKEELFPTFFTYDIDVAIRGGVPWILRELKSLVNFTPLDGLDQFDFNKRFKTKEQYDKEREEEQKEAERFCHSDKELPENKDARQRILDNLSESSSFKPRPNYRGSASRAVYPSRSLQEALGRLGCIDELDDLQRSIDQS